MNAQPTPAAPSLLTASLLAALALTAGCVTERIPADGAAGESEPPLVLITGLAQILRMWNGGYPVDALDRLPAAVREAPVGYIADPDTFAAVWEAFQPGLPPPAVDFERQLILFARNVDVYSRLAILQVNVEGGVAEPVVRTAESNRPVLDVASMSMVLVTRSGIIAVSSNGAVVPLPAPGGPDA